MSQTTVTIYGLPDASLYTDVAAASEKAVSLGATVVSHPDMPQLRAVFTDVVDACTFSIWLSSAKSRSTPSSSPKPGSTTIFPGPTWPRSGSRPEIGRAHV